ncbi:unnamed protein product [Prunus brigantina]
MERAAGLVVHPPYFDGYSYGAWKAKMKSFLWFLDEHVWNTVVDGFSEPTKITGKGDEERTVPKPREEWTNAEVTHSTNNQKGLNALFTAVSPDQFEYISGCENISEDRVVKKILRLLPQRFQPKVTAIEEIRDLNTLKVQELIGSIQTYEMKHLAPKKSKSVAFKVVNEEDDGHSNEDCSMNSKNRFVDYPNGGFKSRRSNERKNLKEKVQCFECEGFGHISSECANTLKKQNDGKNEALHTTWSDSDSDFENNEKGIALITIVSLDEA